MAQVFFPDIIQNVTFVSTTSVKLPSGSRITVGGQQYSNSSDLFLSTASTGVNGLDTGVLGVHQIWYVHAIQNVGSLALVASLSKTAPTGFSTFTWTGWAFVTNDSNQVTQTVNGTDWQWQTYTPVLPNFTLGNGTLTGRWRRQTDSIEAEIYINCGSTTSSSAEVTMQIPTPLVIDSSKVANITSTGPNCLPGHALGRTAGSTGSLGTVFYTSSITTTGVRVEFQNGTITANDALNGVAGVGFLTLNTSNMTEMGCNFTVPIVGWNNVL